MCGRALPPARGVRTMCARIGCPADGLASPSCAKSNAAGGGRGVDCEHTRWSCEEHESRSFLPLMPLSRLAARHSLMLSRSYGGRVCGAVACFWPVLTRLLSVPCLGYKNRAWGAAQGPSKPRNRQMSQPCSHRAGPSRLRWRHPNGGQRSSAPFSACRACLAALVCAPHSTTPPRYST